MPGIEKIKKECEEALKRLSDPELLSNWEKFEELSKKKANFEKIITKDEELQDLKNKIEENKEIIKGREDADLVSLAETELVQLQEKEKDLEKELESLYSNITRMYGSAKQSEAGFILKGAQNPKETPPASAIIEIRAGAGGAEASLFAADLFRMYSKYAGTQGWKQKVLNSHPTELGGFKEIIFELKNGDIFSKMQYEGGVHRVQRIPTTEKSGRVHTSTASVAVLPKPKKAAIKIKQEDLRIDTYRASGPGGQYVNKRETAVRVTHLPTGIVVTSQTERNQLQNKENVMAILEARLQELQEIQQMESLGEKRKAQIKWAKRAEKIRTYNFPQDRVTDHRIKKSFHNIEGIMDGRLEPVIKALIKSGV